jgi:hypothetical protein
VAASGARELEAYIFGIPNNVLNIEETNICHVIGKKGILTAY